MSHPSVSVVQLQPVFSLRFKLVQSFSNTHTKLIIAEVHCMTTEIQEERSWQSCSRISHCDEVGQGTEPMIWVSIVQYVVASGPAAHFRLWNEPRHVPGHLSPAHKKV